MFKVLKPFYRKQFVDPKTRIGKDQRETMYARNSLIEQSDVPLQFTRVKNQIVKLDEKESAALLMERGVIEMCKSKEKQPLKGLNGKGSLKSIEKKATEKEKK